MCNKIKPYIISILIALGLGGASAFLTRNNMNLYGNIQRPPLSPPSVLFPIVWTLLFLFMGISAAIIYTNKSKSSLDTQNGLLIYAISLIVNFFWSIIFFNCRAFLLAFIWLLLLWILILATILNYSKVNKTAAYLQIPYLLWVTFAGYLTLAIYILN